MSTLVSSFIYNSVCWRYVCIHSHTAVCFSLVQTS